MLIFKRLRGQNGTLDRDVLTPLDIEVGTEFGSRRLSSAHDGWVRLTTVDSVEYGAFSDKPRIAEGCRVIEEDGACARKKGEFRIDYDGGETKYIITCNDEDNNMINIDNDDSTINIDDDDDDNDDNDDDNVDDDDDLYNNNNNNNNNIHIANNNNVHIHDNNNVNNNNIHGDEDDDDVFYN
ncbi:hypothetical protein PV328_004118 [Microctonus aethiopoides]|uniref:Uncharacterized protein n=1 Tax=Microctonus aethiopoides TaxID=144406 RepID=A0AA39FA20_9HYME|nr:hypothetical protein PV328_004118 [Microctonus aethiopoides]